MEQAILASENGHIKRVYLPLLLNIVGVVACVFLTILLSLWALNLIFPEPNTATVIQKYLHELHRNPQESIRIAEYDILLYI